jgi:3-isopropylmalate/(R)-2-methylmalate dehydratase small subunit
MSDKSKVIRGRAHCFGDNIDTDQIIPARYCTSFDEVVLGPHCMEDIDEGFPARVEEGDVVVAGENFGCGSSRENAPLTLRGAGIRLVVARSFARIFFRNSINIALPIMECPEAVESIEDGHEVEADIVEGVVRNLTTGQSFPARPVPPFVQQIIDEGGLVPWVRSQLASRG